MKRLFFLGYLLIMLNPLILGQTPCGSGKLLKNALEQHPQYIDTIAKFVGDNQRFSEDEDFIIYIPVIFHIVYNTNTPQVNISQAQVLSQIVALNNAFSHANNHSLGVDTKIRFCLATKGVDGVLLQEPGITRYSNGLDEYYVNTNDELVIRNIDYWPKHLYLNVWVCNLKGNDVHAISSFPFLNGNGFGNDGIVMNYQYCGNNIGTATVPNYNAGTILAHEAGHWLGLFHVFENINPNLCDNCSGNTAEGDQISDTPPCKGAAYDDPFWQTGQDQTKRKSCDFNCQFSDPLISAENYMEYNYSQYLNFFTLNQKQRMRSMLKNYRSTFYNYGKKNLQVFPIECSNVKTTTQPPIEHSQSCNYKYYYPDEALVLNTNPYSYVEICEGVNPVINVHLGCLKRVWKEIEADCRDDDSYMCEGSCPLSSQGICKSLCQWAGKCKCCTNWMPYYLRIKYDCDENFNCTSEIANWVDFASQSGLLTNIDVAAELGFNITSQNRYVIGIGLNDENEVWREGFKYVSYIPYDATFPPFKFSVTNAPTEIKVINNMSLINCIMSANKTLIAGNQISVQGESSFSNIESQLKIDININCVSASLAARIASDSTAKNPSEVDTISKADYDSMIAILKNEDLNRKQDNAIQQISFLPNPSSGNSVMQPCLMEKLQDIRIFNSLGQKVLYTLDNGCKLSMLGYPAGLYYCELLFKNGKRESHTLMVE